MPEMEGELMSVQTYKLESGVPVPCDSSELERALTYGTRAAS